MHLPGLSTKAARRPWLFAAACAGLAEIQAWHAGATGQRPGLWLLLGLSTLAFVWFWRQQRLGSYDPVRSAPGQPDHFSESAEGIDPALAAIREIWMQEGVPRIVVDATHEGVLVPGQVRDRWGHQLVIDLDPRYPLRLEVSYEGCAVDLSFGGEVSRCVFAWPAIYTVQNRGSGDAVVIEARVPKNVASR